MGEKFSLAAIMTFFIILIIGVVLLGELADSNVENTQLTGAVNESITLTSFSGVVAQDDVSSLSFFGNSSNNTGTDPQLIIGTTVNLSVNGTVDLSGDVGYNNAGPYNISYSYEGDLYVVDSRARTLLPLSIIFFALIFIAAGVAALMKSSGNLSFGMGKK